MENSSKKQTVKQQQNNQTLENEKNITGSKTQKIATNNQEPNHKKDNQNNHFKENRKASEQKQSSEHNNMLLNTIYHICNLSMNSIEDVITLAKNTAFQNAITDIHSRYEVISKECSLLAKAMEVCLIPVDCITKFKNWATVRVDALFDCSTQNLAKILYGGTACEIAELIVKQTNSFEANADVLNLAEKLENLQEHHIHDLKKYLSIRE